MFLLVGWMSTQNHRFYYSPTEFTRFPNPEFPPLTMAACKMKKRDGKMPQGNCARLMSNTRDWHCGTDNVPLLPGGGDGHA